MPTNRHQKQQEQPKRCRCTPECGKLLGWRQRQRHYRAARKAGRENEIEPSLGDTGSDNGLANDENTEAVSSNWFEELHDADSNRYQQSGLRDDLAGNELEASDQLQDTTSMSVDEVVDINMDNDSDDNGGSFSSFSDSSSCMSSSCEGSEEDCTLAFREVEEYEDVFQELEEAAKELDIGVELEQECNFYDLRTSRCRLHAVGD